MGSREREGEGEGEGEGERVHIKWIDGVTDRMRRRGCRSGNMESGQICNIPGTSTEKRGGMIW